MNELIDLLLKISMIGVGWGALILLYKAVSSDVDRIKETYESRINELKEQVENYKERIEDLRKIHKEELSRYTKMNKMLHELYNAIENGSVRLVCPDHNDEITLLVDGTLICSKNHRVWPKEGVEK